MRQGSDKLVRELGVLISIIALCFVAYALTSLQNPHELSKAEAMLLYPIVLLGFSLAPKRSGFTCVVNGVLVAIPIGFFLFSLVKSALILS